MFGLLLLVASWDGAKDDFGWDEDGGCAECAPAAFSGLPNSPPSLDFRSGICTSAALLAIFSLSAADLNA